MSIVIRAFQPSDLGEIKRITVEVFDGVAFDKLVETRWGILNGHDWRWRKARHLDDDIAANASGVFVAEENGKILGCITTQMDRASGKGRIPNIAIIAEARGKGLGKRLIQRALDYFRREGMAYAMIETMAGNEVGEHLYPACGFVEIGRQIHYGTRL